jgi:hypothetical protein
MRPMGRAMLGQAALVPAQNLANAIAWSGQATQMANWTWNAINQPASAPPGPYCAYGSQPPQAVYALTESSQRACMGAQAAVQAAQGFAAGCSAAAPYAQQAVAYAQQACTMSQSCTVGEEQGNVLGSVTLLDSNGNAIGVCVDMTWARCVMGQVAAAANAVKAAQQAQSVCTYAGPTSTAPVIVTMPWPAAPVVTPTRSRGVIRAY